MRNRFRLRLFGHPELIGPRGSIPLSPQQWALIALVFGVENSGLPRTRVLPLLWKSGTEPVLLRRLSQLIYSIDRRAGSALLLRSATSLRPDRELVESDVTSFVGALKAEEFTLASDLLDAGFLSGLSWIPTREFEDWMGARHASFRALLRTSATRRWARAEEEGLWTRRTLEAALALHRMSPLDEGGLRRAVWAQALVSTPLEALATFDSYVERTGMSGSASVGDETRALLERVRALAKQPRSKGQGPRRPTRADPTLFGRDAELAVLRPLFSGELRDGLTVVCVSGAAGLGKSRLVQECMGPAALQGRLLLTARLAELEQDIPLNAVIEAFSTQETAKALQPMSEPWRSILLNVMPEFTEVVGPALPIPAVQPASLQRRLLESVRLLSNQVVEERPIVMFLDDFHWVDDSSLAALEYLRRRWSKGCGVLVVTVRPECIARGGRLERFLEAADTVHVRLQALDEVSQVQLIREVGGGDVPERATNALRALGAGNPLYLIELTRQWQEGQLSLPERTTDEIQLPVSIRQLYEHRFRGLQPDAARALEALAVWGRTISPVDLADLAGADAVASTEGLEVLDELGLLRWVDDGVELWHGLIRQAALGRLSEARRRWLHSQAADFLLSSAEPVLDELALHCDRAGRREEARRYAEFVAEQAEKVGAVTEAIRFLEIARRNARVGQPSISLRLGDLHFLRCSYSEAAENYRSFLDDPASRLKAEDHLEARISAINCDAHSGRIPFVRFLAENELLRHEARTLGAFPLLAAALNSLLHQMQRESSPLSTEDLLGEVDLLLGAPDPRAQCNGHRLAAVLRLCHGNAQTHIDRAVDVAVRHGLTDLLPLVRLVEITALLMAGKLGLPDGVRAQAAALADAQRAGDLLNHVRILNNVGAFYLDIGELSIAAQRLEEAVGLGGGSLAIPEDLHLSMNRGELALAERNITAAEAHFIECLPSRVGQRWLGWGIAHAGLGLCALERGALREALEHEALMLEGVPAASPFPVDYGICAIFSARLASAQGNMSRADSVLEAAEERFKSVNVPQFLRLRTHRIRAKARADRSSARALAREALELADDLELQNRARELRAYS